MEVAPRYYLLKLFTLLTWFKLLTRLILFILLLLRCENICLYAYCLHSLSRKVSTLLELADASQV